MSGVRRTVVLLSGGMDSATAAAMAMDAGYEVHALSIQYGQRQQAELEAARSVGRALGVASHRVVRVDLSALGGSALTDHSIDVPKDRAEVAIGAGIPVTYVPARNTVFLAVALAAAETAGAESIHLGINAIDYSGYPDCRPEYLAAMQEVARLGTRAGVEGAGIRLEAPLVRMSKGEIVQKGMALGVPFEKTLSCYDPIEDALGNFAHCGRCDACQLRREGFAAAGIPDPAR